MEYLKLHKGARALCIVAHPDDETIWMGGTIARHKKINWTIFVLCRKSDPDRMPKFKRVAKRYGARGIICDLEDEGILNITQSIPKIKKRVLRELPHQTWDVVFTHGANGEYGHLRHKAVHRAVKKMLKTGELPAREAFFFAYRLDEKKKVAVPKEYVSHRVELSHAEWKAKRNVVKKLYGFGKMSFENRSCNKWETFKISKLK